MLHIYNTVYKAGKSVEEFNLLFGSLLLNRRSPINNLCQNNIIHVVIIVQIHNVGLHCPLMGGVLVEVVRVIRGLPTRARQVNLP